ncbi:hypothetical protein [Bacillus thuringiensis]|uniref:hypothetical protein n=1 Tax=Bacillus thuringiensis TaxID=1428 RepID=UPI00111EC365|nr:hypothetical protein [Bacillus thuringiensis]
MEFRLETLDPTCLGGNTVYLDYETRMRIERERQRIIKFLNEKGITQNLDGKRVNDLPLWPLTLMENKLLADSN